MAHTQVIRTACHSESLAEILERVLDKGVVIAGDIRIKLCDIELLTIQIRLLVASVDKAREMGLTWWWQPSEQPQPPHFEPVAEPAPLAPRAGKGVGAEGTLQAPPPSSPSHDHEQARRRAEQLVDIISHQPGKQRGYGHGQSAQGPGEAPTA